MEQKNSKNILIIIADFYDEISSNLKNGAINYLNKLKYPYDIKFVPGTLEIPIILSSFSKKYDGFIVLSCLIKGETDHYDVVKNISMNEIYSLVYKKVIPLGSAILTVNNVKQAIERSDIKKKNFDFIILSTPTKTHYNLIRNITTNFRIKVLLCEKPFTNNFKEGSKIYDITKKKFKIFGKTSLEKKKLLYGAISIEKAGAFSLVDNGICCVENIEYLKKNDQTDKQVRAYEKYSSV